jgi:hypothetical protein
MSARRLPPPAPHGLVAFYRACLATFVVFATVAFLMVAGATAPGCGATQHQIAAGAIVSTGSLVAGIHRTHQELYTAATDNLRARVQGADYDREVAPIDAAFRRRSVALQSLSSVLFAAAYLNDAVGPEATPAARAAAARQVLETLRDVTQVLADGSVLPAVPIPPEVLAVENGLVALAGGH